MASLVKCDPSFILQQNLPQTDTMAGKGKDPEVRDVLAIDGTNLSQDELRNLKQIASPPAIARPGKKKGRKKTGLPPVHIITDPMELSGLNENEREGFSKIYGTGTSGDPKETVQGTDQEPRDEVPSKEKIEKLIADNGKLKKKNGEISEERTKLNKDLAAMEKRFEKKLAENNELQEEVKNLKQELKKAETALSKASKAPNADVRKDQRMEKLRDDLADATKKLKKETSEKNALHKEHEECLRSLEDARSEIESLKARIEEMGSGVPDTAADTCSTPSSGTVIRVSESVLESELFTSSRYRMTLARDGRSMTFSADIEGKIPCADCRIAIPKLAILLPFTGRSEYTARTTDGTTYVIDLRKRI